GRVFNRNGNRVPHAAPHNAYPCRGENRWVVIGVFDDEQWHGFCRAIGDPEWTKRSEFATVAGRKQNEEELDRLVGEWTEGYTPEEVERVMQSHGVPSSVVATNRDMYEDCQLAHRQHFRKLQHPEIGEYCAESLSALLSKTPSSLRQAAPLLGQHNEHVLREILKLSDGEISDVYAEGAVTTDADLPEFRATL
ncbi:unnamed protein product, partial [marine sediment metagenome]